MSKDPRDYGKLIASIVGMALTGLAAAGWVPEEYASSEAAASIAGALSALLVWWVPAYSNEYKKS